MKRYVRSANKFTNKATQFISKAYTEEGIAKRAAEGSRKGESMEQIFNNIMNDPNIQFEEPDAKGNQVILYNGKNVGWINFQRGMGWIDEKEYNMLEKYVAPEEDEECVGDECYDDEYDEEIDEEYNDDYGF